MNTAIRTLTTMIVALAMVGMLSGIGAATTMMDYNVNFDGMGAGSVDIFTITPIGTDVQQVDWTNCEVTGTQTGNYGNGGWMTIDRDTRIDTAQNGGNGTNPSEDVYGSIITQSQLSTNGGDWTPGRVYTAMTLDDSKVYNDPEDYMELDQTTGLYDSDMQVADTRDGYEKILADTSITARLFDNGGNTGTGFNAVVMTGSDGTGNVSSAISGMLSEGEMSMNVDSRLIDDAANIESSRTGFTIDVPNMPGYSEQNTGVFVGQAAIDGVTIDQMSTTFTSVDNINTTGYFYALN